ncbi:hypothetical protein VmeM32_00080 [Vibrio phage vB_VmeM-32]|nr:hypothetical protein VmeM32_00080 [Vibrio phage vB_VmeM-32]
MKTQEIQITNDDFIKLLASRDHYFEKSGYCGGITYSTIYCGVSGDLIAYREIDGNNIQCFVIKV